MIKSLVFTLASLITLTLFSQNYPQDYFRSPLDIPLYLSGNFGELRSNHFHAGLDIKTQGVEGKPVYAVADGYVSRIKVSPYGYGNALYLNHPNGYTSVYGHLKSYNNTIQEHIKKTQYQRESFSVELFPPPFLFPVKKGDLIAYTGNTGGSGGPHLHFEIRDSKSEHPINPLLFGIEVKDEVNPDIYALHIYPLDDSSYINGGTKPIRLRASGRNGEYRLINQSPGLVSGRIGFGIEAVDRMSGVGNSYGLHNIKLVLDGEIIFEQEITEFAFHEGRYINSHIDYQNYISTRRRVQKSFVSEGNKLRIYKVLKNKGIVNFNDNAIHQLQYITSDLYGNQSVLNFQVESKETRPLAKEASLRAKAVRFFEFDQRNTFVQDNLLIDIPAYTLYDDLYFEYREEKAVPGAISPTYWIHNHYTPLHSYISLSIKMPPMDEKLKEKALIFSTVDGRSKYAEGGKWNGNNISVKTRSFGGYGVALDTIAPTIQSLTLYQGANMKGKTGFKIRINDDFSGIDSFRASIDGKWVLMEYDAKNKMLYHEFDERTGPGKHQYELKVVDGVGNYSIYEASFFR